MSGVQDWTHAARALFTAGAPLSHGQRRADGRAVAREHRVEQSTCDRNTVLAPLTAAASNADRGRVRRGQVPRGQPGGADDRDVPVPVRRHVRRRGPRHAHALLRAVHGAERARAAAPAAQRDLRDVLCGRAPPARRAGRRYHHDVALRATFSHSLLDCLARCTAHGAQLAYQRQQGKSAVFYLFPSATGDMAAPCSWPIACCARRQRSRCAPAVTLYLSPHAPATRPCAWPRRPRPGGRAHLGPTAAPRS